jgi:hypothetical protein
MDWNKKRVLIIPLALIVLIIGIGSVLGVTYNSQSTKNYNVDKTSPSGTYRVKIDVRVEEEGDFRSHFTEKGRIQVLKGDETVFSREWNYRDNWEPTFRDTNPIVEWVGNNALRMGGDNSRQSFADELLISNDTDEYLKHIGVSCGKYENFEVFDLAPGGQITVRPSPGLNSDSSGKFYLGYGGETWTGKRFEGVLKQKQPNTPLKLHITVKNKNLRSSGLVSTMHDSVRVFDFIHTWLQPGGQTRN